ncbi:MAG: hypothetical protein MK132_20960 [Lentisphaerales bacterium]|nr:hypothetical protein [Lentisphaerales bacterium]
MAAYCYTTQEQVAVTEARKELPTEIVFEEKPKPIFVTYMEHVVKLGIENLPALSATRKSKQAAHSIVGEDEGELYPSADLRAAIGREESENDTVHQSWRSSSCFDSF